MEKEEWRKEQLERKMGNEEKGIVDIFQLKREMDNEKKGILDTFQLQRYMGHEEKGIQIFLGLR